MGSTPARITPTGVRDPSEVGERPAPLATGEAPPAGEGVLVGEATPAEATKVGPAPNLGAHAGAPTSQGLLAAPVSRAVKVERPLPASARAPKALRAPSSSDVPIAPVAPALPSRDTDGTRIGLAPLVTSMAPPPATDRGSLTGVEGPGARRCAGCGEVYPADFLVCPRDATPLASLESADVDPLIGSLIGDTYQIVRVVGEGGMGRVYEARHLRLKGRRFAVKCLHADLARNPEMAARFLREAESASSLEHPNVIDVFDVHHLADGTPYLVGEFLEGEELASYIATRGRLEPRAAAKVARQVCQALAAAHERGIVHRDMKPENIFVLGASIAAVERGASRTLHVKVLDFGISKAGPGDDSQLTRTGVIMGTPSYMAPEQARGRTVDHRADIYSVGACLYFMVTGRRPFDAGDPTSTLSMVLTEDPVRPRDLDKSIPEMLELIIQRAMAKDANDRYASMADLEKALAIFSGRSSLAVPSGSAMVPFELEGAGVAASGTQRAFDVARAVLDSSIPPSAQQSGNVARTARPIIVLTSVALGAWIVGGTVSALAGLVRFLHGGEVTLTESLLLVVGCLFAAATPIALYVMHLRKVIWPNSVRAVELAVDLKRVTLTAFVTYGAFAIFGRIVYTVLLRSSHVLASGVWDIALFLLSLLAAFALGGVGPLLRNLRRRRRRA